MLIVIFSIPSVQTYIANKVTTSLNEKYDTQINVGKIHIKYNGFAAIKEVYIADHHNDTLIYSQEVETSLLSLKALMNSQMNLGDIALKNSKLYVKKYKGEENDNLYVFSHITSNF